MSFYLQNTLAKHEKQCLPAQQPSSADRDHRNLGFVDSLRGVAILMVIMVHCTTRVPDLYKPLSMILHYNQMGVQLFFILSAYTMCLSLSRTRTSHHFVRSFYIRRYFRIAPMYYIGIILYFLVNYLRSTVLHVDVGFENIYTFKNTLANFLFIHGFIDSANNTVVPGGWSIGTEMAFYAVFPFIFLLVQYIKPGSKFFYFLPVIVFIAIYLSFNILSGNVVENNTFYYYNFFNQLPIFFIGISLYFLEKPLKHPQTARGVLNLLAFVFFSSFLVWLFYEKVSFTLMPFLSGISFVLLINSFRCLPFFNIHLLKRIGQVSFSMYVLHFLFAWRLSVPIVNLVGKYFPSEVTFLICFLFTVGCTYVLAMITERTIERKGILLGKSLINLLDSRNKTIPVNTVH